MQKMWIVRVIRRNVVEEEAGETQSVRSQHTIAGFEVAGKGPWASRSWEQPSADNQVVGLQYHNHKELNSANNNLNEQGNWFFSGVSKKKCHLGKHLVFSPMRTISDFWPTKLWDNTLCYFKPQFVDIHCNSNRKLLYSPSGCSDTFDIQWFELANTKNRVCILVELEA